MATDKTPKRRVRPSIKVSSTTTSTDPRNYPEGDLPAIGFAELLALSSRPRLTPKDIGLLGDEMSRALRKLIAIDSLPDPKQRRESLTCTLSLAKNPLLEYAKARSTHNDQLRETAGRERNRDKLAILIKRTVDATGVNAFPKASRIIDMLGFHDSDDILRSSPTAIGLYGKPPDPKRTYLDNRKAVYWHDGKCVRCTTKKQVTDRLRNLRAASKTR